LSVKAGTRRKEKRHMTEVFRLMPRFDDEFGVGRAVVYMFDVFDVT